MGVVLAKALNKQNSFCILPTWRHKYNNNIYSTANGQLPGGSGYNSSMKHFCMILTKLYIEIWDPHSSVADGASLMVLGQYVLMFWWAVVPSVFRLKQFLDCCVNWCRVYPIFLLDFCVSSFIPDREISKILDIACQRVEQAEPLKRCEYFGRVCSVH